MKTKLLNSVGAASIAVLFVMFGVIHAGVAPDLTRLTQVSKAYVTVNGVAYTDVTVDETGYALSRYARWNGVLAESPYKVSPIINSATRLIVGYRVTWRVKGRIGTLVHVARKRYSTGELALAVVVP